MIYLPEIKGNRKKNRFDFGQLTQTCEPTHPNKTIINILNRLPKYSMSSLTFSLMIFRGELVGVAGAVGSGKTSLVSAIMGEVRH